MGGCLSIQLSGDIGQSLDRIFRFRNLKKNLNDLDREMKYLTAIKDEVMNKVTREERLPHTQRRPTVREWLARVEEVDTRSTNLVSTSTAQLQNLYLCGLCSTNVRSSYNYMESVLLLLEEVTKLIDDGKFETVTELTPTPEVMERPTWHTVGQEEMLERAWTRLMDENVGIMGLHGMGGVGKTTLFNKIHNKFAGIAGKFHTVIWIVVSQGASISKLQEDIAQKLHLCGGEWTKQNQSDKAAEIYSYLKKKRFVLMLDDIWEKVDLEAIGVPEPTRENGCKVAFTTRSEEVCKSMGDHEPMQVKCLEEDQAWELFKGKIGDNTLRRVPVELARKVADKCHGLPLALSVIGGTMASKTTVQEWEDAIDTLTRNAAEFSDMENDILLILKYSYDNLKHEHIKSCFVYCALFPEDDLIDKERLIEYWICEGFMGEYQDLRRAINKGYGVLGTLTCANLLMEVDTETVVMHDVVREMALWIASDLGKNKENFVVQARVGLRQVPRVKNWGAVRRMSLMRNDIEEMTCSSKCCELTTLLLQKNYYLKNLSGEVIQYMQKLLVLDLSSNSSIEGLPEQISELTSLQYLDLSYTSIEQLPVGFQELKKLTHLNLSFTKLRSISGISKLSSLRSSKLFASNVGGDVNVVKELQLLEHLQVLTIDVSTELGLEQISGDRRLVNCIYRLSIHDFQEKPFNPSLLVSMKNLREFGLANIHVSDMKWDGSEKLEVINKKKATKLTGLSPFEKLEVLNLDTLTRLESIYWSPLPFPLLRRIKIRNCPKLRKLPLNATSVSRIEKLSITIVPRQQQTELEWEDDDTKNRFLPLIQDETFPILLNLDSLLHIPYCQIENPRFFVF